MAAEIEVLVRIESGEKELQSFLHENAVFREHRAIEDIYFYDPLRRNLKPDSEGRLYECARLRNKEGISVLTYKVDHFDAEGKWTYSDEFETKVESFDAMAGIIRQLGLRHLTRVSVSKTYFDHGDLEIAVEEVERLGSFLEVEYKGVVLDNHAEIKRDLEQFVRSLPCITSREFDGGKPEMMIAAIGIDDDGSDHD